MSNPNNRKLLNDLKIIFMLFYCVSFSFEMDVEAVSESNVSEDSESNNRLDEIISDQDCKLITTKTLHDKI